MKKTLCILLSVCMIIAAFTGCSKGGGETTTPEPETTTVEQTTTAPETTPETTTEEVLTNINPLTGWNDLPDEAVGKRPVAVMVNNVSDAMPQYGIAEADVVFEVPVEGGATRLLAIYADYQNLPDICSVRSYRYYFPQIALGFDAFYVHWGEDMTMMDYYYSLDMASYDGMSDSRLFGRDSSRLNQGYNLEHTSVFYGTKFAQVVADDNRRVDLGEKYQDKTAFNFTSSKEMITPDGKDCLNVYIGFGGQSADLEFDAETKTYRKYLNGRAQIDGNTGEQLSFENVIVLETEVWTRDDGKRKGINMYGGDGYVGYYVTNGKVQQISWSKNSEYDQFVLKDTAGNILEMNKGKTYFAVTGTGWADFGNE